MKDYKFMDRNNDELIDFRKPNLWMSSIEHEKKVSNGGELIAITIIVVAVACYFIFR